MKKEMSIIYIVICMIICLIPFAGMVGFATNTTTENKVLASFPKFIVAGQFNSGFFDELTDYFEDHFAFREFFVNVDAIIQSKVFCVSNVDSIVTGTNGWLYYSATLDDYLGQNLMSERSIYNAAHNLSIIQSYVENNGATFAVTVPPNKNSLYGENMPYYDSMIVSAEKNIDHLQIEMENQNVNYIDLFSAFKNSTDVLYLKRDSHWNNMGAVLAYNEILSSLGINHDLLETVSVVRRKTTIGDLNTMIYPLTAVPEWNYNYEYEQSWNYISDADNVDDAWIQTENPEGEGTLLMFRDSFGNTLLPLMANTFSNGFFSQGIPYNIGEYMNSFKPDTVIIEKVERNINQFSEDPPLMQSIEVDLNLDTIEKMSKLSSGDFEITTSENNASYWCIEGSLDAVSFDVHTNVYIQIISGDKIKTYEAFLISSETSDYGYRFYLSKDYVSENFDIDENSFLVNVIAGADNDLCIVHSEIVNFTELLD